MISLKILNCLTKAVNNGWCHNNGGMINAVKFCHNDGNEKMINAVKKVPNGDICYNG